MKVALLVSTYNWPEALEVVLNSLKKQSVLPDEVLIADDGSGTLTKVVIEAFRKDFKGEVKHIWHEDKGFRKSIILNKAIAQSAVDYIIQVDGDCIMHRDFIKDHKALCEKGFYLYGSRVNIKKEGVESTLSRKRTHFNYFSQGIGKRGRTIHFPLLGKFLYKPVDEISSKFRGCNVSFWREDIIKINGYNEDMTGWGREDSELIVRLMNTGIKGKRLKFEGIVYHLWHKTKSKGRLDINDAIEQNAKLNKEVRCENGISKYVNT